MSRPLLFQEAYFYENTPVDENTDYDLIKPVIWDCQELYIQDILGSPLYNLIKQEIIDNAGSLSTARLITLNNTYVAPCLLNYVLMDSQITMLYKMRNQSVMTNTSDNSNPIDFTQHKYLKDEYRMKAEAYADKIERYLCANTATFPEYTTYTSSDEVRAQNQHATTSVFLKGTGLKGRGWEYYEQK